MAEVDLPLERLREYRPPLDEPDDFDAFWASTLAESRAATQPPSFTSLETPLRTIAVSDVTFAGYVGQPIRGWLLSPAGEAGPLPTIVEHLGYGGGRGTPLDWLRWAWAGSAYFVRGTRGQGPVCAAGDTSDIEPTGTGPQVPRVMTRGILDPSTYYYRRLMTDSVLAVDAVRQHPVVDPARMIVHGGSQGGALTLAAAALADGPVAALVDVPFLSHFRRALQVTDALPYDELRRFLRTHRHEEALVFRTLSYFDVRS